MIFSKWLVDEELAKNSSLHFELISTIVASKDCEIRTKMLIKIEILSFQVASHNFFYWSIGFMIKRLFQFTSFTISKRALEMTFELHRCHHSSRSLWTKILRESAMLPLSNPLRLCRAGRASLTIGGYS